MDESLGPLTLAVLILPGVALLWTSRLVYGRRGAMSDDALKRILSAGGILLLLVGLLGIIIGFTGPFSIFPILVLPAVLLMAVTQYRQAERRALLEMLAVAAERGIPLDVAAQAFAEERHDELGLRAGRLADSLAAGTPLPEALASTGHPLPVDARLAVRVGCEMSALGPALRRISGLGPTLEMSLRSLAVKYLYLMVVAALGFSIITFVMIWIIPKFALVFEEFALELPAPTMLLVQLSKNAVYYWPLILPAPLILLVCLLAATLNYVGWLPRWLPIVSLLTVRYDGSLVMRTLALAVEQQRSIVETIRLLTWQYPLSPVRQRLSRVIATIDQGSDWCDALLRVGLIRSVDAAVLKAAQRVGNLGWALDEMADSSLRRTAYIWHSWLTVLMPLLIVGMGAIVCFITVSLFLPLISLIWGLAS